MIRRKWLMGCLFGVLAGSWLLACEATVETTCVGGDGTCDSHELAGPVTSSSSSSSGSGAGGGAVCFEGCDPDNPSGLTGEYPCEVEAVMDNCRRCHSANPTLNPGPFPLDTYEESQVMYGSKAVWFHIRGVIESEFMPLQAPKLNDDEKDAMIEWACSCGPPREPGVTCP